MLYLVTIKRNAIDFTSIWELKMMLKLIFRRVTIQCSCIELDSIRRLHLHALIDFKRTPYYKKYMRKGWHIYLNRVDMESIDTVIRYINKNNNKNYINEKEILSYSNYYNMFED